MYKLDVITDVSIIKWGNKTNEKILTYAEKYFFPSFDVILYPNDNVNIYYIIKPSI